MNSIRNFLFSFEERLIKIIEENNQVCTSHKGIDFFVEKRINFVFKHFRL